MSDGASLISCVPEFANQVSRVASDSKLFVRNRILGFTPSPSMEQLAGVCLAILIVAAKWVIEDLVC